MKQLSTRTITIISLIAIASLALGVFVVQKIQQMPQNGVENEVVQETQTQEEEMSENAKQILDSIEERLASGELVWYEMPNYGLKFPVTQRTKEQYDEIVEEAKVKGVTFVWYQVPELGIEFLVTPDMVGDLKYVSSDGLQNHESKENEGAAFFYKESVQEFVDDSYLDPSLIPHSFSLVKMTIENISIYEKDKNRLFCNISVEPFFVLGDYGFCVHGPQTSAFIEKGQYDAYIKSQEVFFKEFLLEASRLLEE